MAKLGDTVTGARVLGSRVLQAQRGANPDGKMPLMEHIRELRNRVLKAALALVVGMGIGLIPSIYVRTWTFIEHPFCKAVINHHSGCKTIGDQLVLGGVLDPFMFRVKIAFYFGLVLSSPVWLYQVWAFVAPGLYRRERRWTYAFVLTAVPLFVGGGGLAYLVMSRGLGYLLDLTPIGVINLPTVDTYLGYVTAMLLGFGLAFELPLAMVMLNMAGILSHERVRKWRRIMIFLVFVFAGIASPSPDPVTMLLLAIPCVVLIEAAEVIVWANDRRRGNRSPYAGLSDDEVSPLDDMSSGDGVSDGVDVGPSSDRDS
jgi:sec-independent protein translocase protein TatC